MAAVVGHVEVRELKAYVAVTDNDWFKFLARQDGIDEVNFWQPGGGTAFRALPLGGPLLFKLRWPENVIAGGGFFTHFTRVPVETAWDTFGLKNGADSYERMRALIERHREAPAKGDGGYTIGCIVLQDPFFLPRKQWIPAPPDFARSIVRGKGYNLRESPGRELWQSVMDARVSAKLSDALPGTEPRLEVEGPVFGDDALRRVRLRPGAWRSMLTDFYGRQCAISGERALPVLEAAHIRPVALGGPNRLGNGLLLRSDVHTLFDRGYITVTPAHRIQVAKKQLKDDFDNGEPYVPFHGKKASLPGLAAAQPAREFLEWHADTVYRG